MPESTAAAAGPEHTPSESGGGRAVGDPLLEVDRLSARYGRIEVLRSVSLRVREGEIVAVVGPIGAGKTTLLTSLIGVHDQCTGTATFRGENILGRAPEDLVRRGIALVPERRRIFPDLTVLENLRLGAAVFGGRIDGSDRERLFGLFPILEERLDLDAGFLSGGEAQQLAIARALLAKPKLLLLDEPTLGLAPRLAASVFDLLNRLREEGLTILVAEQNALRALEVADRGNVLSAGQVVAEDAGEALAAKPELVESYLGVRVS